MLKIYLRIIKELERRREIAYKIGHWNGTSFEQLHTDITILKDLLEKEIRPMSKDRRDT